MNWFKIITAGINEKSLNKALKDMLKKDKYVQFLFNQFGIDLNVMDTKLQFIVKEMDGKFAEANHDEIHLSKALFENGLFFQDHLHFVIHELIHWLHRQAEKKWYFNDLEEIQSFTAAIAWEIHVGKNSKEIEQVILPIIRGHFKSEKNAKAFYVYLYRKAVSMLKLI